MLSKDVEENINTENLFIEETEEDQLSINDEIQDFNECINICNLGITEKISGFSDIFDKNLKSKKIFNIINEDSKSFSNEKITNDFNKNTENLMENAEFGCKIKSPLIDIASGKIYVLFKFHNLIKFINFQQNFINYLFLLFFALYILLEKY